MQKTVVLGFSVLVATFRTGDTEIFKVDPATGDAVNLTRSPGSSERYPSWSFDGSKVAFNSDRDGTFKPYVMDAAGKDLRQLTHERAPVVAGMQSWTADGTWIYFGLFGGGLPRMCRIHADGSGFEVVHEGGIDPAISPGGKTGAGRTRRRHFKETGLAVRLFACGRGISETGLDCGALPFPTRPSDNAAPRGSTQ
jgi:Tol biopolymer transport system component